MIDVDTDNTCFNIMVLAFSLYEVFKAEILPDEVMSEKCMPATVRRTSAGRGRKGRRSRTLHFLKVTEQVYDRLRLDDIWSTSNAPPVHSPI